MGKVNRVKTFLDLIYHSHLTIIMPTYQKRSAFEPELWANTIHF